VAEKSAFESVFDRLPAEPPPAPSAPAAEPAGLPSQAAPPSEAEAPPRPEGWAIDASPSGFYWVRCPVKTFGGRRFGKQWDPDNQGEIVIHANEGWDSETLGGPPRHFRLVDEFIKDLGYVAEPVPIGVPPIPRAALSRAGLGTTSSAVDAS